MVTLDPTLKGKIVPQATEGLSVVHKGRIYLKPGQQAPQGIQIHRGKRGGIYYEGSGRGQAQEDPSSQSPSPRQEYPPKGVTVLDTMRSTRFKLLSAQRQFDNNKKIAIEYGVRQKKMRADPEHFTEEGYRSPAYLHTLRAFKETMQEQDVLTNVISKGKEDLAKDAPKEIDQAPIYKELKGTYVPYSAVQKEEVWHPEAENPDVYFEDGVHSGDFPVKKSRADRVLKDGTPEQEQAAASALSHIPDSVKSKLGVLKMRMSNEELMEKLFRPPSEGEEEKPPPAFGLSGLAVYKQRDIHISREQYENAGQSGYIGRTKGMKGTVMHEVGHFVAEDCNIDMNIIFPETRLVSTYGATTAQEGWAEAFANAILNPHTTLGPLTERALRQAGFER